MTRVVGRFVLVLVAVSLVAASTVNAVDPRLGNPRDAIFAIPGGEGNIGPRTFVGTGFEPSEGYALGALSNTNGGWRCLGPTTALPPTANGPRCPGTLNPAPGNPAGFPWSDPTAGGPLLAGVTTKGHNSSQGLQLTQNFRYPGNTVIGNGSAQFKDPLAGTINVDFRINDNGGADYTISPQAPSQGFNTSRVVFAYNGYIYALDNPGGTLQFVLIGTWQANTWQTLQFQYDFVNQTVDYSMGSDKDHLNLLYHSPGPFYGGTQTEEVVFFSDNYQNTGLGPFVADPHGPSMCIDNLIIKPEPGTLAMLGAGALLAIRRRRR